MLQMTQNSNPRTSKATGWRWSLLTSTATLDVEARFFGRFCGALGFAHDLHFDFLRNDEGAGRNAVGEENVCADRAAFADNGVATHDSRPGINGHAVLNGRMPLLARSEE